MSAKLWGARFKKATNPAFERFSSSISEDHKLAEHDIRASKAHCRMLKRIGVIKPAAATRILKALDRVAKELDAHRADFAARRYEDIHSFIESELVRLAGPEAKRIHTARSRNDQVNQAVRMYCKDAARDSVRLVGLLQRSILAQAKKHSETVVAGYTHLQKAQPVVLGHWFLSYVEELERSKERLKDCARRIDVLTLGSGALAGTAIPIDREGVRKELGFAKLSSNSIDAVGSRDFIAEFTFVLALLGTQLSRIAEDLLIGQIEEIGWFEVPEELCTGSSMMPQKRNPDFLELSRGASSVLTGNATALLVLLKGLPSSYNRDLQWDKEPLFRSVETATQILALFKVLFDGLKVREDRVRAGLADESLCATDIAEYLVTRGVAFRDAHEQVGKFLLACADRDTALSRAPESLLKDAFGKCAAGVRPLLNVASSVKRKKSFGGTNPSDVKKQVQRWEKTLADASL